MEPDRKPADPASQREGHCPIFGVENGAPAIGLGLLLILFALALLLSGPPPDVTLLPAFLFSGFGAVLVLLGIRR